MKNWTLPLLVGLAVVFFGLSYFISRTADQQSGLSPLASAEDIRGTVYGLRKNSTKREKLSRSWSVASLDSMETGGDGEFVLKFETGYEVRVLDSTLLTLDKEEDRVILIIKRGDVHIEKFGSDGKLVISKEGRRFQAPEYEMQYKNSKSNLALTTPPSNNSQQLTSQQIQDTLNSHKNDFYRCYTQLLQKTPGVSGQSNLAFTIDPSGRVVNPSISSSSLSDKNFQACLVEVISRIHFKSFPGESISTVFPIKFE